MPNMQQKSDAIEKMNRLAKARIPFLFIIDFLGENSIILTENEIDSNRILFAIGDKTNAKESLQLNEPLIFSKKPQSIKKYVSAFKIIKSNLDFGNTYLANLTQPTAIQINRTTREIFYQSKAPYKLWLKDNFVVFSPEIFIQIKQGKIKSFPMKGTIDAGLPNAENELLNNEKETAEHNTIIDLIRNDLSMVASNVYVKRYRYIDKIRTNQKDLLQVSSEIEGEITANFLDELGNHFFKLLPAGSISGAPKKKTIAVIREAEKYDRNFYTGVFGFFDGENLDSSVMIRFIEEIKGNLVFKSGGGITTYSDSKKEYNELIDKVYVPIY